jgi:hypothetical protein
MRLEDAILTLEAASLACGSSRSRRSRELGRIYAVGFTGRAMLVDLLGRNAERDAAATGVGSAIGPRLLCQHSACPSPRSGLQLLVQFNLTGKPPLQLAQEMAPRYPCGQRFSIRLIEQGPSRDSAPG